MHCSRSAARRASRAIPAIAVPRAARAIPAIAVPRAARAIPAIAARCARRTRAAGRLDVVGGPRARRVAVVVTLAGVVLAGAGCSGSSSNDPGAAAPSASQLAPPRVTCGTSRTAVNVPVIVEVEKGSTSCHEAMQVQTGYTGLVKSGRVGGNGGGAPVKVDGWTCQGTDTTTTVQTGEASECRKGTTEIVAVLKLQGSGSGS
jgi:hypothetical protein